MSTRPPSPRALRRASDAFVQFALLAFRPESCRWTKDVRCAVAAMTWNACAGGARPLVLGAPGDPVLLRLMESLSRARRRRWPDETCEVLDLDVRAARGEVLFSFLLTWDHGASTWPCRVEVEALRGAAVPRRAGNSGGCVRLPGRHATTPS